MADNEQTMDEESLKFLDQVKKGKPRKFVMICKGERLLSLILYKKGTVAKYKKQAKEQGKGQFYHGVAGGKGINLLFKLAREDGFEEPPIKDLKLKNFLNEQSGGKFKPTFEIVDQNAAVLDEDDPLVQRFLQLQPAALEMAERDPEAASFLNQLCLEAGKALEEDDGSAAELKIEALEKALSGAGGEEAVSAEEMLWKQQRAEIDPQLQEKLGEGGELARKLVTVVEFAEGKAGEGEFVSALKALDKLRELMAADPVAPSAATGSVKDTVAGLEIRNRRVQAGEGIARLQKALRDSGDQRAGEIAEILDKLATNFPTHIEKLLEGLAKAHQANRTDAIEKLKPAIKQAAGDWVAFLKKHELEIEGCENNPWKIPVSINQPIKTQLKSILTEIVA